MQAVEMSRDETHNGARLILVRHGESEGNRDRTFTQSPEVPLTPNGREQVRATAERIAASYAPARIVASPYTRARQTAEIIGALLALPVELEAAFREQSFGVFAGQPYDTVLRDAAYHDGPRWQWRPPGGESLMDVSARVVPAFERLAGAAAGQDVVVVSHGGVMLALCAHVTGSWDGLSVTPNAGVVVVERRRGRYAPPHAVVND
ncbi:MAG TPA: histidine phosphatase family protein [Candidatus Acidoferrales bacterium]|nr:histidine phosphatase family protein [Candidatus Acidoferrales bacterium]